MKEKLMAHKNLIIGIVAVIIVAIVIALVANIAKPSYKKQIKDWAKACESEEKMEKYVKKNVNLRALYATMELMKDTDNWDKDEDEIKEAFEKEYKEAKKKDYEDSEFIEDVTSQFMSVAEEKGKVTKVEKLEKDEDAPKGSKTAEFTVEFDGKEFEGKASFYKGKIVSIYASESSDED